MTNHMGQHMGQHWPMPPVDRNIQRLARLTPQRHPKPKKGQDMAHEPTEHPEDKTILSPQDQRTAGKVINQMAQQIDPAGRHRVDVNANAMGRANTKQPGNLPQDLPAQGPETKAETEAEAKQDHTHVRDAGPDEMKNPPRNWGKVDEESDESFPASDPPGNY